MFNYLRNGNRWLEFEAVNGVFRIAQVIKGKTVCEFKSNNRFAAMQYWRRSLLWLGRG